MIVGPVLASFVLRLLPTSLAEGELVGQAENVATGHVTTFRNVDELIRILCGKPVEVVSRES